MLKKLLVIATFLLLGIASNANVAPFPECFPCP